MRKLTSFLLGLILLTPCLLNAQAPVVYFSASVDSTCGATLTNSFTDFSGNNPTHWKWYFPGATPDTSTLRNPTNIQYKGYGCYDVKLVVSNKSGSDSLTKTNYVCLDQPLKVYFTGPTGLCIGSGATITAYGGTQYHWSTGQTTSSINIQGIITETYTVQVRSGACFLDTSFTVHVDTMPTFVFKADTFLCQGQSTTIYAYSPNSYGIRYLWNTGDTTDSLVTGPLYNSQVYYVTISKGACSKDSSEITIKVHECNTGIGNYSTPAGLQVFPDPASTRLLIQSSAPFDKNSVLIITDVMGRKVYSEPIGTCAPNHIEIDVSSLAPAVYFLQLQTSQEIVVTKFVKQ